jgi:hypothetical protein
MNMIATHKIKDVARQGAKTIKAARGDSECAAQLRRQLGISAALAIVAGALGFFAMRAARGASAKADEYFDWKEKDKKLDSDLEDTLDASDPVAKY